MRITVRPAYWIFTAILSLLLAQGSIPEAFLLFVIILVSVVFHELGHALTAKTFGRSPRIELVAMGGVTYHDGDTLPFWKQFLITLGGPVFGLVLAILSLLLVPLFSSQVIQGIFMQMGTINLFWTLVNLIPVLPLDGGQLLRLGLEKWFDFKGLRYTFLVSGTLALLASLAFFGLQQMLAGAIFFLFAFENLSNYRKSRTMSKNDQSQALKEALMQGEKLFRSGRKEEALAAFQALRIAASSGLLYDTATQYAAAILSDQGESKAAYDLLKTIQERLDPPTLLLFHRLAFDHQDDPVVSSLGASVFQLFPLAEVALRNAYAAARLNDPQGAVGWLETAQQNGVENLREIIQEPAFDRVRHEIVFKEFVKSL